MATLNIKAFPDDLYEALRKEAEKEHRSISQQVTHLLSHALRGGRRQRLRLTDLRGLGKEVWEGVDAAEYVAAERDSWES
ncbi:MAG: hypothetical protein KDD47_28190 [Acidobacteria bacterium]|nr:hypothetical protein [Acidobacteriota bacterium]